jgi:hypothetical protein
MEMKRLFSIVLKNKKGGEVAHVFLAIFRALDAELEGIRCRCRVCC